jgi:3-methyladenine DNA glycosylase AlkD
MGSSERAQVSQRFFKTGPGEYGEGDVFLGIRVPELRKLVTQYKDASLSTILKLLRSPFHEARLLAVMLLVRTYTKGDEAVKERVYRLYLQNTRFINNWDLVDSSAPYIVGDYLFTRSRKPLYELARSSDLWERRIAIIATQNFIRRGDFTDALKIAKLLLEDQEDLIHKAVGWMLREIGDRHLPSEEEFLKQHHKTMPRTMLRYAIEKFPKAKRERYKSR